MFVRVEKIEASRYFLNINVNATENNVKTVQKFQ